MKYTVFIFAFFLLISCGTQKPIIIRQFYPFNKMTDTSYSNNVVRTIKEDYFLISNFRNDLSTTLYVDSFVRKYINIEILKYNTYRMYFYKETKYTNVEKIAENPRELDRYSSDHDLVYDYTWIDGKFEGRIKIRNGEQVEPELPKYNFTLIYTPEDSLKSREKSDSIKIKD